MRLTLRTLLAYLEDTLEPAATKEIGQKLAETPAAQELVSRIKDVTRRRRLTAPPVVGDDVDPNLLAEYLDNLLSSDAVAQVERICLESDIHLAETAACHQILTLLGQPACVSENTRKRMIDLVQGVESIPPDRRRATPTLPQPPSPPSIFAGQPVAARVLSVAAIVFGVIGIGFLIWVSVNLQRPKLTGSNETQVASVEEAASPEGIYRPTQLPAESEPEAPNTLSREGSPTPPNGPAVARPERDEEKLPLDSQPPAVAETTKEMPVAETPSKPGSTEDATKPIAVTTGVAPAETTKAKPAEADKPEAPPLPPAVALATYASTSGVLMHMESTAPESRRLDSRPMLDPIPTISKKGTDPEWRRLALRSPVHSKEPLLCLPAHRAAIQLENGSTVELAGDTELFLLPAEEDSDARVQMARGKIVLSANNAAATFQVDFLDQSWRINIKGPELAVGMSLTPMWRPGGPFVHEAVLYVPRGEVELQTATQAQNLGGPVQIRWSDSDGFREKESLAIPPAWMEKEEMTPLQIKAAETIERTLRADSPAVLPLIELVGNARKEVRLLAVRCLGAVGRLPALIDAMNTLEQREVRQEAVVALRQYLTRGRAQEDALEQALFTKFKKPQSREEDVRDRAAGVLALLRGFSDNEVKQRDAYDALIRLLNPERSPEICIRELAIMNLEEMAGKPENASYSPDKPNENAINAWRRAYDSNRLPPKERGKM